jgi:hypothetical protein
MSDSLDAQIPQHHTQASTRDAICRLLHVYQLVRRMGMKCTMISKAFGDRTPLQVKNRWCSVLHMRGFSVFDDIDMMMTLRSRVRKGESIADLILD